MYLDRDGNYAAECGQDFCEDCGTCLACQFNDEDCCVRTLDALEAQEREADGG